MCRAVQKTGTTQIQNVLDKGYNSENIFNYVREKDIANISIYGWGVIGKKLYQCLENRGIKVSNVVDRDKEHYIEHNIEILLPLELKDETELLIVTSVNEFEEVKKQICELGQCEILSLMYFLP